MRFQIVAVLFALLPALTSACASYAFCLCQDGPDNRFNDGATKKACANFNGTYRKFDDGRHYCSLGSANAGIGGVVQIFLNNCRFKTACHTYGATADSNCWAKA
ncbi:hypothetical protein T440DRAFT_445831 [Plenodomus tracheiphilus IPT5]|uniref:Extracellular membrane protein CFEM domain-containing protein n=1 Tax=Plenodomus tracheiphilus IPT5 TaxID=1408161 RepID=A0A6A7BBY8_9PLEO|nr:hypothetical protein T440DRAFT_445831 [Plenodomus tracheiphilus IPT5]